MDWIALAVGVLFTLLGGACVLAVVLQLPGTWALLVLALVIELLDGLYLPPGARVTFGVPTLLIALGLALLGELLEFLAAALGLRRGGGTRRGLVGAFLGGFAGLFLFAPLFALIPLVGAFLGVLLGTFLGALLGELTHPEGRLESSLRPAAWAALGRLLGTTGKTALALAMWLALGARALWRGWS